MTEGCGRVGRTLLAAVVLSGCRPQPPQTDGDRARSDRHSARPIAAEPAAARESAVVPEPSAAPAAPAPAPESPLAIDVGGKYTAQYFAAAPRRDTPLVVMLHGMCALPEYECPAFRRGTVSFAALLCPPGPAPCRGGGAMWSGSDAKLGEAVQRSSEALAARLGRPLPEQRVLIGYSLGATAAARLVVAERGRWSALMLVNAAPGLHARQLIDAGVTRLALVAGQRDRTRPKLERAAQRLERAGLAARFFELEATGHYFDAATEERLRAPLEWLLQAP